MKILFTRFPLESALGGAEIQTLSLMKGLQEHGHDVSFLGSCPTLLKETESCRLSAVGLLISPPPVTKWNAISFVWRKKKMKELLDAQISNIKPQGCFMLSMTEKILMTEELASRGIKVFWIEHDRIGRWLTKNPWLPALRRASQFATTITVSELSRKILIDLGWDAAKTIAIPNGIDLKRFEGVQCTEYAGSTILGCVTRLTEDKGVDVLIDAVTDLPEVTVKILGRGREEGYLRKIITERHLNDRITLMNKAEDLGVFYASLGLLILPSREHDPFGLVAVEAMSLGVPVIVTDACGIADYLTNNENALIVKAGSTEELRTAIRSLIDDPVKREKLAKAGQETVQRDFTVEKMIAQYEAIMER